MKWHKLLVALTCMWKSSSINLSYYPRLELVLTPIAWFFPEDFEVLPSQLKIKPWFYLHCVKIHSTTSVHALCTNFPFYFIRTKCLLFVPLTWSVCLRVGSTGFRRISPVLTVDEGFGNWVVLVARQGDSWVVTPVWVLVLLHHCAVPRRQGRLKHKTSVSKGLTST